MVRFCWRKLDENMLILMVLFGKRPPIFSVFERLSMFFDKL